MSVCVSIYVSVSLKQLRACQSEAVLPDGHPHPLIDTKLSSPPHLIFLTAKANTQLFIWDLGKLSFKKNGKKVDIVH